MKVFLLILVWTFLFHGLKADSGDDCVLSEWDSWGPCSKKCSTDGIKTRNRTIVRMNGFFGDPCSTKKLSENTQCGIENNFCEQYCDRESGDCHCKQGFALNKSDKKSCVDINECDLNYGRGKCAQKCENLKGSYRCSCYPNFYLAKDKHDCHFNTSSEKCNFAIQKYSDRFECVCKDEQLIGLKCNKRKDQCNNVKCMSDSVCLLYDHPSVNCFAMKEMVAILHPIGYGNYNIGNYRYIVELYITSILDKIAVKSSLFGGNFDTNEIHSRDSSQFYYVEGANPLKVKSFTYVLYAVFNIGNNLTPANPQEICSQLEGTDVHCLTQRECNILKSEGISCPYVHASTFGKQENDKESSKIDIIIIVVCLVLLLALIAIVICFVRRRGKWQNLRMLFNRDSEEVRQVNDILLRQESQNEPPPPYTAGDLNLPHIDQFDQSVFKDEPLNKNMEEPVYESVGNLAGLPEYEDEYESMNDIKKVDKVDLPNESEVDGTPRYVAVPCPTISGDVAGPSSSSVTDVTSDEPHYVAPTSNRPL